MAFTPLNALNAFIEVARRRSYAAAAKDLGVSTSALSQSVRQLEVRLGVSLLARTSRSVALTEAGQRLLDNAGPAVDQALDSLRTVTATRGEITGRVRLTVPNVAVTLVLSRVLPAFAERHPKAEVEVHVEDQLVDSVAAGLDAGIRLIESIDRDMVHVRLSPPGRLIVAGAPSYLARRGTPSKPKELLQHDCICMRWRSSGEPWAWELERGARNFRIPVRGPVTTNSFELMRSLAVSGVGLLYAFESSITRELAKGTLVPVLEAYAATVPGLFLYFPNRAHISPTLEAFVKVAREVSKGL